MSRCTFTFGRFDRGLLKPLVIFQKVVFDVNWLYRWFDLACLGSALGKELLVVDLFLLLFKLSLLHFSHSLQLKLSLKLQSIILDLPVHFTHLCLLFLQNLRLFHTRVTSRRIIVLFDSDGWPFLDVWEFEILLNEVLVAEPAVFELLNLVIVVFLGFAPDFLRSPTLLVCLLGFLLGNLYLLLD